MDLSEITPIVAYTCISLLKCTNLLNKNPHVNFLMEGRKYLTTEMVIIEIFLIFPFNKQSYLVQLKFKNSHIY